MSSHRPATDAVQLLKAAGYTAVATASPKNFDLVKEFGASAVYDCAFGLPLFALHSH